MSEIKNIIIINGASHFFIHIKYNTNLAGGSSDIN